MVSLLLQYKTSVVDSNKNWSPLDSTWTKKLENKQKIVEKLNPEVLNRKLNHKKLNIHFFKLEKASLCVSLLYRYVITSFFLTPFLMTIFFKARVGSI